MAPIFPEAEAIPIYIGIDRMGMADVRTHGGGASGMPAKLAGYLANFPAPVGGDARSEKMTYTTIEE